MHLDGLHKVQSTCNLIVLMVSDNMVSQSVTLKLPNIKIDEFLDKLYDEFINLMPNFIKNSKKSNIHLFNIESNDNELLISLAVSLNYEKDVS